MDVALDHCDSAADAHVDERGLVAGNTTLSHERCGAQQEAPRIGVWHGDTGKGG